MKYLQNLTFISQKILKYIYCFPTRVFAWQCGVGSEAAFRHQVGRIY